MHALVLRTLIQRKKSGWESEEKKAVAGIRAWGVAWVGNYE